MIQIRTIKEAFAEIKSKDNNTSLTLSGFRKLVVSGEIPSIRRGNKWLVDMAVVESYFKGEFNKPIENKSNAYGNIRRLEVI